MEQGLPGQAPRRHRMLKRAVERYGPRGEEVAYGWIDAEVFEMAAGLQVVRGRWPRDARKAYAVACGMAQRLARLVKHDTRRCYTDDEGTMYRTWEPRDTQKGK